MAEGIKEIKELHNAVKLLAVSAKQILSDGKINISDLPVLLDLIKNVNVLVEGIKGVDKIPAEAKDLDAAEMAELAGLVIDLVNAIKA